MDFQKRVLLSAAGADFIRNGESGKNSVSIAGQYRGGDSRFPDLNNMFWHVLLDPKREIGFPY